MNKNQNSHHEHQTILLEWETPEFVPIPRGKTWYIVAGSVLALIVAYALFSGNITMALVFILVAIVFLLSEKKVPRDVTVTITDLGIYFDGKYYPYHHINAFWLVYHPPYVRALYLRLRVGKLYKHLKIELNHQKPQEVRQLLLKEVPEIEGAQEPIADLLARILRFQ
jgi:hypothetical protein